MSGDDELVFGFEIELSGEDGVMAAGVKDEGVVFYEGRG